MKIQSITELDNVQFFLFYQIDLRRDLLTNEFMLLELISATRPVQKTMDDFFISAYPFCEIPDEVKQETINWDLQRAKYNFNDKTIFELFVYYKLYKKEGNQYLEIKTPLDENINVVSMYFNLRYEQSLDLINIIEEYQKTREAKENEIVSITELHTLFKQTWLATKMSNLEFWG